MTRHAIFILTASLSLTACSNQTADKSRIEKTSVDSSSTTSFTADTSKQFSITNATADDFTKAENKYKDKILYDTTTIRKKGNTIKLSTDNGGLTLTDTLVETDETAIREYQYYGQFPSISCYIIYEQYYEGSQYILVNKHSGKQTVIWNKPKLSPSDKFVANLSLMLGMEGIPNGMQIWSIDKNDHTVNKFIEIDQQNWAPYNFYWETDSSLIINVNEASVEKFYDSNGDLNTKDSYFLRLTIK